MHEASGAWMKRHEERGIHEAMQPRALTLKLSSTKPVAATSCARSTSASAIDITWLLLLLLLLVPLLGDGSEASETSAASYTRAATEIVTLGTAEEIQQGWMGKCTLIHQPLLPAF